MLEEQRCVGEGASVGGRGMISASVCIDHLDPITLCSLDDLWCVCVRGERGRRGRDKFGGMISVWGRVEV